MFYNKLFFYKFFLDKSGEIELPQKQPNMSPQIKIPFTISIPISYPIFWKVSKNHYSFCYLN